MPFFIFYLFFPVLFIAWRQGEGQQRAAELWQASPSALAGETGGQDGGGCASLAGCGSVVGLPWSQVWTPPLLLSSFRGCCNPLQVTFAQVLGGCCCCSSGAGVTCGAFSSFVTLIAAAAASTRAGEAPEIHWVLLLPLGPIAPHPIPAEHSSAALTGTVSSLSPPSPTASLLDGAAAAPGPLCHQLPTLEQASAWAPIVVLLWKKSIVLVLFN